MFLFSKWGVKLMILSVFMDNYYLLRREHFRQAGCRCAKIDRKGASIASAWLSQSIYFQHYCVNLRFLGGYSIVFAYVCILKA